ncbi:MAG: hypothetical protein ACREBS_07010 [Nitrososphaerales archaeon]
MIRKMRLSASLGRAAQKMFSLSILTCWHHESTRHPSVGGYWQSDAYKKDAPYVKEMPLIISSAKRTVQGMDEATRMEEEILH